MEKLKLTILDIHHKNLQGKAVSSSNALKFAYFMGNWTLKSEKKNSGLIKIIRHANYPKQAWLDALSHL